MIKLFLLLMLLLGAVNAQGDNVEINNNESEAYKAIEIQEYIAVGAVITGSVTLVSSLAVGFLLSDPEIELPIALTGAFIAGAVLFVGGFVGGVFSELEKIRMDSL